jgi:alpha-beta hydrolase superfamily lysophospholipase
MNLRRQIDILPWVFTSNLEKLPSHMSADLPIQPNDVPAGGLTEAIYFDSGDHELFGWLHLPASPLTTELGLVICAPFGYEAVCAHRSVRALAEAAATLGVPALRFDYLGTGDSADIEPGVEQLEVWTWNIVAAVGELRRRAGVRHVCLLGLRLGATLATLAARHSKAVTSLVLIAPVISGRRHLRELRTRRLAASGNARQDVHGGSGGPMEVSGFTLSATTVAALAQVDLNEPHEAASPEILLIDGSTLPTSAQWSETLRARGVPMTYVALPGLIEMIMTAPQFAKIPQQMIAATRDWLTRFGYPSDARRERQGTPGHALSRLSASPGVLRLPDSGLAKPALLTERPVLFGSDVVLFGIVTEPLQGEIRRRAVILLNAGADYHIGASGLYVALARRWARRGYVVLRMDLGGLGDSGTKSGRPNDEVFPPTALDDIRAAIEFVRGHYGAGDISLAGLCSGAYHALRAAVSMLPVSRVLMINPQNFFWHEGATVNDMQVAELVRNPGLYRDRMFSLAVWKRLLTGQINISYISKIYLRRLLLAMGTTLRNLARRLRIHLPRDLGWEMEKLGARGVQLVFVFARGEPGIDLLKYQGGSSIDRLGDRCRIHLIDNADHVFSQSGPRSVLENVLSDELFALGQRQTASRAEMERGA